MFYPVFTSFFTQENIRLRFLQHCFFTVVNECFAQFNIQIAITILGLISQRWLKFYHRDYKLILRYIFKSLINTTLHQISKNVIYPCLDVFLPFCIDQIHVTAMILGILCLLVYLSMCFIPRPNQNRWRPEIWVNTVPQTISKKDSLQKSDPESGQPR